MDIYKLKNIELIKVQTEFKKTAFGKRAKTFSIMPLFVHLFFLILFYFSKNTITEALYISGAFISLIGLCVTQLIYGNMLKDYINKKEEK